MGLGLGLELVVRVGFKVRVIGLEHLERYHADDERCDKHEPQADAHERLAAQRCAHGAVGAVCSSTGSGV